MWRSGYRLLCSCLSILWLFQYLPFDPLFCRTYGGFRLLGFSLIPFLFYFCIVCSVGDVITIFSLLSTLFAFFFHRSLTVYCTLNSLLRSLFGPTPGSPLGPRGPACSEDHGQLTLVSVKWWYLACRVPPQ